MSGQPHQPRPPDTRRVVFFSAAPQSIGHVYRVEHVAGALKAAGWQITIRSLHDDAAATHVATASLVSIFRGSWGEPFARIRAACSAQGIPLVFDIDDLLFDPAVSAAVWIAFFDTLLPAERERWIAAAGSYQAALAAADAAVLTTPALAAAAAAVCRQVQVLPNALDRQMEQAAAAALGMTKASAGDGRPRFIFAGGTPTHHRDFAVAAEAIARVMHRRPEPILVILGHLDPSIYSALTPFAGRIETRPPVPLLDLFSELARCDLNLCPLELANPFNEAKSNVRWLTAAAVGLPSIVTPTGPLQDAVTDWHTGLVANNVSGWEAALDAVLDRQVDLAALGVAARLDALGRFGFTRWSVEAAEVYAAILDRWYSCCSGARLP